MPITQQNLSDACKHLRNSLRNMATETYFAFQLFRHPFAINDGKKARLLAELTLSETERLQISLRYTTQGVRFEYIRLINHGGPSFKYFNKENMLRFEKICLKQVKRDLSKRTNLPRKLKEF